METMQLVRFSPEYQDEVIALHHTAIGNLVTGIDQYAEEADLRDIGRVYIDSGGDFLVGLAGGRVMAMGGFMPLSSDEAELRRMRILPEMQGKGYGSLLLLELERRALQKGIRKFSFETARARALTLEFYGKHGYHETGSGFYGQVPTVHFTKYLDDKR